MTTSNPAIPTAIPTEPTDHGPNNMRGAKALQTVLTRLVDAREGLDAMIERAEPKILPILRKIREDHHESATRVAALILAEGGEPDSDGSLMSTVNKAVVSIRAIFDDIDDEVVIRVVEGEQHVVDAYEDAQEIYAAGHVRDALADMRQRLVVLLDEARRIAA